MAFLQIFPTPAYLTPPMTFSALTLLLVRQKGHRPVKKLGVGLLVVMI